MKTRFVFTFLMLFTLMTFAQNDLKARIEYEAAEEAFVAEDHQKASAHLTETEKLLGKWTPKVGYLQIVSLSKTLDYENLDVLHLESLDREIKKYMQYADKSDNVDLDKFKEINAIEKDLNDLLAIFKSKQDPDYRKAMDYLLRKDYKESLNSLKIAYGKNNIMAIYELAKIYHEGSGVSRDSSAAFLGYKKAAESGVLEAMLDLGTCYQNGFGTIVSHKDALTWYQLAITKNYFRAYLNIGNLYLDDKNYKEALYWYQKAEDKGYSQAICMVGKFYEYGYVQDKDPTKAMIQYRKAAHLDNGLAMRYIGDLYWDGNGVRRDHKQAIEWYQKAELKNNIQGIEKMGDIYEMYHPDIQNNLKGEDKGASRVRESFSIAIEKYKLAAELGSPSAMFKLGTNYRFYELVSYESALQWIDLALKNGYKPSGFQYATIGDRMRDYKVKLEWYTKSYKAGNTAIKWQISEIYRRGLGGIEKDKKWLKNG